MSSTLPAWVQRKLHTARSLSDGDCGGTYGDAVLIVAAVVSGIAAEIWPGERIDRLRFCEIWAAHAEPALKPNRVSLPLLIAALEHENDAAAARALRHTNTRAFTGMVGLDKLVVAGEDVDRDEVSVRSLCPSLNPAMIRSHTYGNLFYTEARSPLTHQFKLGESASGQPMLERLTGVSYTNDVDPPYRRIHFHMEWLDAVVRSIALSSASLFRSAPHPKPARWWVLG